MTADRDLCWKSGEEKTKQTTGTVGTTLLVDWCAVRNICVWFSKHRGSTWKCALEDEKCLFFDTRSSSFDKPGAPSGKRCLQLRRLAASQGESDGVQTQHDGFACRKHEPRKAQTTTALSFPLRWVLFFEGSVADQQLAPAWVHHPDLTVQYIQVQRYRCFECFLLDDFYFSSPIYQNKILHVLLRNI